MDKENELSAKESIMAYIDIRKTAKINSILYYSGKTSEAHKGGATTSWMEHYQDQNRGGHHNISRHHVHVAKPSDKQH